MKQKKQNFDCLLKKAEQGDSEAQFDVAFCYEHGEGVAYNYEEALKWYKLSSEQGNEYSQFRLGLFHHYGFYVMKNDKEAI